MIKYIVWMDINNYDTARDVERGVCELDKTFMQRMRGWIHHGYEVWVEPAEDDT